MNDQAPLAFGPLGKVTLVPNSSPSSRSSISVSGSLCLSASVFAPSAWRKRLSKASV